MSRLIEEEIGKAKSNYIFENSRKICAKLMDFMVPFQLKTGNVSSNIVYTEGGKYGRCYRINDPDQVTKMFDFFNEYHRSKVHYFFAEKQLKFSGIMHDYDIYQSSEVSKLNSCFFQTLTKYVFREILDIGDFSKQEGRGFSMYVGILKRDKVRFVKDKSSYKDSFHMIFPSIKVSKGFKRLLIIRIKNKEYLKDIFTDNGIIFQKDVDHNKFLDNLCACVPVFFVGSERNPEKVPMKMIHVFRIRTSDVHITETGRYIVSDVTQEFKDANIPLEFSINWEKPHGIIRKVVIPINSKHKKMEMEYSKEEIKTENKFYDKLSSTFADQPLILEIRTLLKILPIEMANYYHSWMNVLMALKNTSENTKEIAEEFSRRSKKFDKREFNMKWENIKYRSNNSLTLSSIHYWAKKYNPIEYNKIRKNFTMYEALLISRHRAKVGELGHTDIARLLHKLIGTRFVVTRINGCKEIIWFEKVTKKNRYNLSEELFKWVRDLDVPSVVYDYLSNRNYGIFKLIDQLLSDAIKDYEKSNNERNRKWLQQLIFGLKKTIKSLSHINFQHNVAKAYERIFMDKTFGKVVDTNPDIIGLNNGILNLKDMKLQTIHDFKISKFSEMVSYSKFDPNNKLTKRLLISLRSMFPDNETDTFEFIMTYFASALDGHEKEPMILFLIGKGSNGKTCLLELMKNALGAYGVKMTTSFLTCKKEFPESASPQLMMLKRPTRFVYYSETNDETLNAAKMKKITGGETLSGRQLYGITENFITRAIHVFVSNLVLDIDSPEYGTWRRVKLCLMKMVFKHESEIDKNNPYEKALDEDFNKFKTDPDALSAFFSILTYYYQRFKFVYDRNISKVPHPHIREETNRYKYKQDRIEQFIDKNCIILKNNEEKKIMLEETLESVKKKYEEWYKTHYSSSAKPRKVIEKLRNSKLQKHIVNVGKDEIFRGMRFLSIGEMLEHGEVLYSSICENKRIIEFSGVKTETPKQFHKRIIKEHKILELKIKERKDRQRRQKRQIRQRRQRREEIEGEVKKKINNNFEIIMSEEEHNIKKEGFVLSPHGNKFRSTEIVEHHN